MQVYLSIYYTWCMINCKVSFPILLSIVSLNLIHNFYNMNADIALGSYDGGSLMTARFEPESEMKLK